ncbi:hypothetical protein FNW54_04790 [Bacteroides sp. HF-5092]|uniref:hypothetical protein n=1 Tax=Bacteroides TaxID=816 RepID=UPI001177E1AF|nr:MULTISPECIES: hypothetical protein [Bacteroides]TRX46771.1 hypothetical protein FNW54_04790 [Bacteroides sp. HF-5092]
MKKKESNDIEKGQCPTHVSEPVSEYGVSAHRRDTEKVSQMMTQKMLDEECITLSESRSRILKKVHNYFRKQ